MLEARTREILCRIRDEAARDGLQATFVLHREQSHLMRIGNSSVSLNTTENLTRLDIRVVIGKREGAHTVLSEITSADKIRAALQHAVKKARVATEKEYEPLFQVVEESIDEHPQYDAQLAALDPAFKAEAYGQIFKAVGHDYNYSGSWSSGEIELYLISTANSNEAYHLGTDMQFSTVLKHPEKKWELLAAETGWRVGSFSAERVAASLSQHLPIYEGKPGVKLTPGNYTILFGHDAIAELIMMSIWTGFMGRYFEEKQSWTAHHKLGDRIFGSNVTILDSPMDDNTFRYGFDLAGKRRMLFPLVEEGVFTNLIYDLTAAAKFGKNPTGHHGVQESIVLMPGNGPEDPLEAVANRDRVLFIPALHYMNIPNLSKGIFTASSRFSATVVDKGAVVAPLLSSRVTDTFRNVFGNVAVMGPRTVSVNVSNTYERRMPVAVGVPAYMVVEGVKITDSADSF